MKFLPTPLLHSMCICGLLLGHFQLNGASSSHPATSMASHSASQPIERFADVPEPAIAPQSELPYSFAPTDSVFPISISLNSQPFPANLQPSQRAFAQPNPPNQPSDSETNAAFAVGSLGLAGVGIMLMVFGILGVLPLIFFMLSGVFGGIGLQKKRRGRIFALIGLLIAVHFIMASVAYLAVMGLGL